MRDLSAVFKAYDVRGTVPEQLDADACRAIGTAFANFVAAADGSAAAVVARDMRESSTALAEALIAGITAAGLDVVDAGLASTDLLYYGSGALDLPGLMLTASHNPANYNGLKFCRAGAVPIGQDSGLSDIRDAAQRLLDHGDAAPPSARTGRRENRDLLPGYAEYLHSLVDLSGSRPLTVVVDAANGMAGHTVPSVLGARAAGGTARGALTVVPMYFDLDGTFPNHEANPLDPANLIDLCKRVVHERADLGLAFDGDADRCFLVDETGEPVNPSAVTALVAARELRKTPGQAVVHNLICSRVVPEVIRENGGIPVRTRVGHSFIKAEMARTDAVFGGEHSAHYYFRDFWRADTGMLAALHVLAALGETDRPLSALLAEYHRYAASGEVNSTVADPAERIAAVRAAFADRPGAATDEMDGLTVELADRSWFNLRPSNTEPLLRLNVEAADSAAMAALRDEVLAVVRS